MAEHDVVSFAGGLSARLAARTRHVCAFLGAGTSRACGLPDVATLQERVVSKLDAGQKSAFENILVGRNLEQVLSRLRRIAAIVEGTDSVDGLDADSALKLDGRICEIIVEELASDAVDLDPVLRFAAWVARADYSRPLEIFTVNYDLLLETALERWGAPYFDGFIGTLRGKFRSDLVDPSSRGGDDIPPFFARLWKLHGSLNWALETRGSLSEVVRLGIPVTKGETPAAIYPSDTKYEESRRVPFVVLQDRLRRALAEPETIVLVSGYSWADEHLNEPFFEAATRRPRSEIIAFCFDNIPDSLAAHATVTPNLQVITQSEAILGGIRAPWKTPVGQVSEDIWKAGSVTLGDFRALASFLARGTSPQKELGDRIADLLRPETPPK